MRPSTRFSRFVTAVHRRAVVIRVAERVGVTLACAAGVGGVLAMVAGWRGVPASPIVLGMFAVAMVVGGVWGWLRRPTKLDAVVEADRQLKLDDLLSSAMLAGDGEFGQAVRAMAERACGQLSPSRVVVNRLGGRSWGGIGLAWALVMTLSLLASNGSDSRAGDGTAFSTAAGRNGKTLPDATSSEARRLPGQEPVVDEGTKFGTSESEPGPGKQGDGRPGSNAPQAATASGGGTAETGSTRVDPTQTGSSTGAPVLPGGETAGGVGAGQPGTGSGTAGGLSNSQSDHPAAPWPSDRWPADRAAAMQSVKDGRVPDAYRDVVREYFSSEPR